MTTLTRVRIATVALLFGLCPLAAAQLAMPGRGPIIPPPKRTSPSARPSARGVSEQQRLAEALNRLTPKERKQLAKTLKRLTPAERRQFAELLKRQLAAQR